MDYKKAEELRKRWGNKPCSHPSFEKETMRRVDSGEWYETKTGDYVCSQCGKVFTRKEKENVEKKRRMESIVQLVNKEQTDAVLQSFNNIIQIAFPDSNQSPIIIASREILKTEDISDYIKDIGLTYDNYRIVRWTKK